MQLARSLPAILSGVVLLATLPACGSVGLRPTESATGPAAVGGFRGVLVQRTTEFTTTDSNDSIPSFDTILYDTEAPADPMWTEDQSDRITVPAAWDGQFAIIYARGAWKGHYDFWVEMKLYRNAERPIGTHQEDKAIAITQHAANLGSPFQELASPPIQVFEGDYFTIAFRTPDRQTLIAYENATTLFGAYLVQGGGTVQPEGQAGPSVAP